MGGHGAGPDVGADRWARLDAHEHCYLTTAGRRTGRPHTVEIWFAMRGPTLYLLSGGGERSDWVRNLAATPGVEVRIGDERLTGVARIVTDPDEDRVARDLLVSKYGGRGAGDLSAWRARALPVALDLTAAPS